LARTARRVSVVVRDPWPGNPARRTLTAQEAMSATFLASVCVA